MMKDLTYWKNYIYETDPVKIEKDVRQATFKSRGLNLSLKYFETNKDAPNILWITGAGCHSLYLAELEYHMHLKGYNVFGVDFQGHGDSEGKRGDFTINELVENCSDAAEYISSNFNRRIGPIGGSLGGMVTFYLGLAHGPVKSMICQLPGILTEKKFHDEVTKKAKNFIPLGKLIAMLFPKVKIPTALFVDWKRLPETDREREILDKYMKDPDIVKWCTIRAAMSQISTPPPNPIDELKMPTMFLAPRRDKAMSISYVRDLYDRLPPIKKKFVEVDGGHYWLVSHPVEAAKMFCDWFEETL